VTGKAGSSEIISKLIQYWARSWLEISNQL
jgi:hypothetical protein